MRDYGKIEVPFWSWAKRKGLSDQAKLLAAYLLSGPHSNSVGCYELPVAYVCADMKWVSDTVEKGFKELSANRFAYHCDTTDFVFVRDHLHHNPPANPKVGISMTKIISDIPRDFKYWAEFIASLEPHAGRFPKGFIKGLSNGIANHEQEQEQENEQEHEEELPSSSLRSDGPPKEVDETVSSEEPFDDDPPIPPGLVRDKDNVSPFMLEGEKKPKNKHPLPENWTLTPPLLAYAEEKSKEAGIVVDWADVAEGFVIHHRKVGSKFKDWDAAWQNWVRNHFKFGHAGAGESGAQMSQAEQNDLLERKKKALGL